MHGSRRFRRPSAPLVLCTLALFVALAGAGYAANGGNFILGQSNSATSATSLSAPFDGPALRATNNTTTSNATALALVVGNGRPPLTVNSAVKVKNLNVDKLDDLDSSAFLKSKVPVTLTGSTGTGGVLSATNTGGANGVQGVTASASASGVYGQNDGGGFGVAGRSNAAGGVGVYAEAEGGGSAHAVSALSFGLGGTVLATNDGGGSALELHSSSAPPMIVDSRTEVANLNADLVDGASILSNRIVSTTHNDHVIQLPGFGDVNVVSCDHTNAAFEWSSGGPPAYVTWYDVFNPSDDFQGVANIVTSFARPHHFATIQLARATGSDTSIATVTLTTNGADCVFAAQAVVQPG